MKMRKILFELIKIGGTAIVLALLITMIIKPTVISGYSMHPTIEPNDYIIINRIAYVTGTPEKGDIVVFKSSIHTENGSDKDFIKRIIGLPGDTLSINNGIVYLNGEALDEPYIYGNVTPGHMEEVTIEDDRIFVMGDNRPNSLDSRDSSVGQIDMDDVIGRVLVRLYPFDHIGRVE